MNTTSPYKTIIRFDQAADQTDGSIKRVVGFVQARNMLSLFDDATLDANPRSAKANSAITAMKDSFEFKVPVELLVPSDPENDQLVSDFEMALLDICAARNNNAQLTTEAKANQRGFYEEIRKRLAKHIADRVEWKSNEW